MNEQRVGSREVKTICWSKVQGALFARRQMGGLVGATPLIWTSSVSPTNVNYGGLGGKYVIGGRCPSTRIPPNGRAGNELPLALMMGSYAWKFKLLKYKYK